MIKNNRQLAYSKEWADKFQMYPQESLQMIPFGIIVLQRIASST
jgi:hypothetical protein